VRNLPPGLTCLFLLCVLSQPVAAQSLKRVAKKLPQPTPQYVLEMLDALTRRESGVRKKATLRSAAAQQDLIVYKGRVDVTLDETSSSFRGSVAIELSMAADVHFTVDLDQVELAWNRQRRVLKIKLPSVKVGPVSRDEDSRKLSASYRGACFPWYDGDVARDLERKLLKEKYDAEARLAAGKKLTEARKQARAAVHDFAARLLMLQGTDIVIEVE
jgi:hypothetical protein